MTKTPSIRPNFLAFRIGRGLLRSPSFPLALQGLLLLVGVLLVWNGWGIGTRATPGELQILRKTSLTTLLVWGLWWPGMILGALAFGRLWCTVCPLELASRGGHGLGRWSGVARGRLPRVMRSGWIILAAYVLLQLLVAGFSIHRIPHATALLLLGLGGCAFGAGFVFREERAFCKGLCPAAALLSVYGRESRFQLDRVDAATCAECRTKDCTRPDFRDRLDVRSCPSLLRPFDRHPSDGCVLCFQCAKVCPSQNIGFGLTSPAAPSRRRDLLNPFEAAFVMVAAGFVSHEVVGEVAWLETLFHVVPAWTYRILPGVGFGWHEALWFLLLVPILFWGLVLLAGEVLGQRGPLGRRLRAVATGAAPVVAVAHAAKALAKLGGWGGYLPLALREPGGLVAMEALRRSGISAPKELWGISALGWVMLLGMILLWTGLQRTSQTEEEEPAGRGWQIGFAGSAVFFAGILVTWIWA